MATNKYARYTIGVDADTTEFDKAIKQAFSSLKQLGEYNGLDESLIRSARAARDLEQQLKKAFNQDTGKLDLSALQRNLEASGKTLQWYANEMEDIDYEGVAAFTHVAQAVQQSELPLKRANKLMDSLWVTMKNTMRWQITTAVLQTFTGAFEQALRYSQDLDESLNNIRIVTSKSAEDMAKFAKSANEAAKRLSTTTVDYTDASLIYYQQGLSDEEVLGRTETTIKLANAAGESARTASEQMTAIWNNFYDGSKSLDYYADILVKLGASTASSSQEIATGIERFAAIGNTVGLSYEYATAALATVTAQTRQSADVVGTAFRTLFSRLQDLELGKTLDDGVTLGKYSKALETVGIDIIDANGNLVKMDDILDRLGDKWKTLNEAQKTSLAQTVGGVRQYTQLIALMDSWDFFQENLSIARGAAGSLDEQAAIYAESWEAARDRVQASAESIYNSLINPQFFIDLDNTITPFLDNISTVIDAMGGMNGVLATTVTLVNQAFGDKMVKNLQNIGYNLGVDTGEQAARARLLQREFAGIVDERDYNAILGNVDADALTAAKQYNETVGSLVSIYDSLDEVSQDALKGQINRYKDLQNEILKTNQILQQLEDLQKDSSNSLQSMQQRASGFGISIFGNPDKEELLKRLQGRLNQGNVPDGFEDFFDLVSESVARDGQIAGLNQVLQGQATDLKNTANSIIDFNAIIEQSASSWAAQIVNATSAVASLGMAIQGVKSLGSIFTDQDMDNGERFISIVTSLGMTVPMLTNSFSYLSKPLKVVFNEQENHFEALGKSTIATQIATKATELLGLAEGETATRTALLNAQLKATLLTIGPLVAGIALLGGALALASWWYNKDAEDAKKAAERSEELASTAEKLKNEYDNLKQSIEDYQDAKEALDKLAVGAEGYAEALSKANEQAEALLDLEPALQARARRNALTGAIEFEGLEEYQAQRAQQAVNSSIISRNATAKASEVQINADRTALKRSIEWQADSGISNANLDKLIVIVQKNGALIADDLKDFTDISDSLKESILNHAEDIKNLANSVDGLANKVEFFGQENVRRAASDNAAYQDLSEPEKAFYDRTISNYIATQPQYTQTLIDEYAGQTMEQLARAYATTIQNYSTDTMKVGTSQATFYDESDQAINVSRDDMVQALALAEAYNRITDENSKISQTLMDGAKHLAQYGESFGEGLGNFILNRENSGVDFNTYSLETLETLKQSLESEALEDFDLSSYVFKQDGFRDVDSYTQELLTQIDSAIKNHDEGSYWDSYWAGLQQSAKENLPKIYESMTSLMTGKELDEEQIKYLEQLEEEYTKLGEIRDRTSNEYIASLRDIQEGYETDNIKAAIHQAEQLQKGFDSTSKSAEELSDQLNQIMDADYQVTVAMEADISSDLQELEMHANALMTAGAKIGEGFIVGYEDIENVVKAFPGILEGYQVLADGTIKLNEEVAASAIQKSKEELAADQEAVIQKMQAQYDYHMARAEALRQTAVLVGQLASGELKTDKEKFEQRQRIESAYKQFLNVELQNQEKLYDTTATNEIAAVNEVGIAIQDSYGQSARNVASAYDSMLQNSHTWATDTIEYVDKVGEALRQVSNGEAVNVNIPLAGTISSMYKGGYTHYSKKAVYDTHKLEENNFLDYLDEGDYAAAQDWLLTQANVEEETANLWLARIAEIQGRQSAALSAANSAGKGKGTKSSGAPDEMDKEIDRDLRDIEERYHEINREIEYQSNLLEDLEDESSRAWGKDKLEAYSKQMAALTKQQENYNDKLDEAQGYLEADKANLIEQFAKSGIDLTFKENGELEDYKGVLQKLVDDYNQGFLSDYNTFVQQYNALSKEEQEARKEERDMWEDLKAQYDDTFDKRVEALNQYEETIDTIQEVEDNIQETAREIADLRLSQIEHRLEVVLTVKDMRDAVDEFSKELAESFNDALTHGEAAAAIDKALMDRNVSIIDDYKKNWQDLQTELANVTDPVDKERIIGDIEELQGKVIGTAQELLQWAESLESLLPDAIDAARDRFSQFIDQLEHNESVLDTIKELYALQGITYKTMAGYNKLVEVGEEKLEAQTVQAQLQRTWFEKARNELLEAETALKGVEETDPRYDILKANRDALLAEYNEAQEAMLQAGQAAMETAQAMYLDAVEKAAYDFGQAITNGMGLDLLQDKYDHYIESEERYLDKVNEAYEVASWYDKLQADIDNATNTKYKDRLKVLQEEIDVRREGNQLSQYDLDILEAKYKVLQAQMALEDAQNNKNQLRLVRDRQGNWNYQYTADADQIASAEQGLLDAENEWYNIAKDQVKEVTGEIVSVWQECNDAIKEIYSDMTLTDEERSAKAAEIYQYYTEKVKFLEAEKQVSISDMTEAGNKSLIDNAILTGDTISDITGVTSEDIKNIIDETGTSVLDLLLADNETIKEIVGSNTELVDLFDNVFAEDLGHMTDNTLSFEQAFDEAMNNMQTSFDNYGATIDSIAGDTGTSLDNLKDHIDYVAESTDHCRELGESAALSMWDQLDSVHELSRGYAELADSVYDYIAALQAMSKDMSDKVGSASKLDYDENFNYDAALSYGIAHGLLSNEAKAQLEAQRKAKQADNPDAAAWGAGTYVGVKKGDKLDPYIEGMFAGAQDFLDRLKDLGISFDTGGYTGDFANSKLAFLHQKELVLNEQDTQNMLAAVNILRSILPSIEKTLDLNASAGATLMAQRIGVTPAPFMEPGTLEQLVRIEHVEFPNVVSSDEIQNAFASLVNDAAQWAKRRTS